MPTPSQLLSEEEAQAKIDSGEWTAVDNPQPIRPGFASSNAGGGPPTPPAMDKYFSGSLAPVQQLQPDLVNTQYQTPAVPQTRLWPVGPVGLPSNGASTQSGIEKSKYVATISDTANQANSTANTALAAAQSNTFQGAWSSSVNYVTNNQVSYGGAYYVALKASINEEPDISPTFWQQVGSPNTSEYLGAYNSGTSYVVGNQVTYNQNYYICILATTGHAPTNTTYWQQISSAETYLGAYSGSTAYVVGNQVQYQGSFWICISATTGNAPSTTSSFWTLLGTSAILIGTWSSSVAYVAGNQVEYTPSGGATNYYIALQASTNQTPGAATNAYWYLIANNTAIASASSYRPTTNPLSATDAGSSATITIANFTMNVAGVGAVSVNGGSITGLSYGTLYYIYYADPAIAGGSVTYQYTTTKSSAISSGVDFFVGSILTPLHGGQNTVGNNDGGTGSQSGFAGNCFASSYVNSGTTLVNPANMIDGNTTDYGTISVSNGSSGTLTLAGISGIAPVYASIVLNVLTEVSAYAAAATASLEYPTNGGVSFTTQTTWTGTTGLVLTQITLSATQNIGAVQVRIAETSSGVGTGVTLNMYGAWLAVSG
jgi:hypothetical protein